MTVGLLDIDPGSRNVITEATAGRLRLVPLTVEQYHRMIDAGILAEDSGIELLDGMLVPKDRSDTGADPLVVGEQHAYAVNQLASLLVKLDRNRMYVQTQQPVAIPEVGGEPEPDAAVVLRPMTEPGKPMAADVSCVVEVAGSSLDRDRMTKLRHYARGGIPHTSSSTSRRERSKSTWCPISIRARMLGQSRIALVMGFSCTSTERTACP